MGLPFMAIGAGASLFVRRFEWHVFIHAQEKMLKAGRSTYSLSDVASCRLAHRPQLKFVELMLKDGGVITFMPTFCDYYEMKAQGAWQWWLSKTGG